ncbi:hypothetical protein Tco_1132131 [Tanacetum coccineum]|uniref:Uncharacterized protein n=1 Tax=Tanacetum coccineum TaxID=301880 RepID=A0ABQ5JB08_9ASTR
MFIKYSTGLIPPKKSRGKGSQGKKAAVSSKPASDDESDAKLVRKRTGSRRVIKKKVTISADDNIIPEPDVALELGKSMSLTEAAEEEAARQPHAGGSSEGTGTKPRVLDESTITPTTSSEGTGTKPGVLDEKKVTSEAKADVTLDLGSEQESEYSEEDQGDDENIPWESTNKDEEKKDDDDADDDKSIDHEKTNDGETNDEFVHSEEYVQDDNEETDDELVHSNEQVNDDEDEEMTNAEDADTRNCDEEISDAEKAKEVKDDIKKAELPPSSSSLSVSSGFGNQFLTLSSDTSLIGTVKNTTDAEINSLLDPSVLTPIPETPSVAPVTIFLPSLIVSSISHVLLQTTTPIPTPPITTKSPPVITIPDLLHAIIQRVYVLEKDVQELKEVDNSTTLHASLRSKIPSAVNAYLGSSLGDALQKVLQKHMEELIQHYPQQVDYKEIIKESVQANVINDAKNQLPKFLPKAVSDFATPVIQSTVKKALEKTPLLLDQSSSQAQSSLKAAESLDDAIASGQADPEKILRKRDCDDEDPLAGPNQGKKTKRSRIKESEPSKKSSTSKETSKGKSPAKTSKSGKFVTAEKPVKELVFEMASNDIEQTVDDVANDADQPPDESTQTKDKDPKKDWFKQPLRPPTPDPK